ncbi:MAG: hypothetical protein R3F37_08750 [Candidatus Competibacteraceae bacterium]
MSFWAALFAGAPLLLGDQFSFLEITLIEDYKGVLLLLLPPGGFLVLGFLLAGKQLLDQRQRRLPAEDGGINACHPTSTGRPVEEF